MKKETKLLTLAVIFVVSLTVSFVIGQKLITILGITFSASALTYALTFPMTDTISEIWGKEKTKTIIWLGFFAVLLNSFFIILAAYLPASDAWSGQKAFSENLLGIPRYAAAGLLAYIVSQHHDVSMFHKLKQKTNSKHLWLRNNLSTITSQFIDTTIFVIGAFLGSVTFEVLLLLVGGQFTVKVIIGLIDTPVVYSLVRWIKL